MSNKSSIPNVWDDDWESLADKPPAPDPTPAPKLSKSQRRAQHAEQQRHLWNSADNPDRFHWLEAQGVDVPLKQEIKPQVTLLSRKPEGGRANGAADDEEDSGEEARRKREAELEERQRRTRLEREEKQRKYAEARERIMGSSTPGTRSPAAASSRESSHSRRGRGRGGAPGGGSGARGGGGYGGGSGVGVSGSRPSSADQSPARMALPGRGENTLFDPDDMGRRLPRRDGGREEQMPTRQPRGPERGVPGFGGRGGRG